MTVIGTHPARLDLYVHAGDPVDVGVPVLDSTGAAVTLTSWTASAQAQDVDGQVLYDFAPTIVDGQIQIAATSTQTAEWTWTPYAARLVVTATPPGGGPIPVATGWVRFYPH